MRGMRIGISRFLGMSTLLLGLLLVALPGSGVAAENQIQAAESAPHTPVEALKREFGFSTKVAEQRLAVQEYAYPLDTALPEGLGDEFSSIEFDGQTGTFIVRVKSQAGARLVPGIFNEENVPTAPRIEVVGFNADELEARLAEIVHELEDRVKTRDLAVNSMSGHPLVQLGRNATDRTKATVQELLRDDFGSRMKLVDPEEVRPEPTACSGGDCDDLTAGTRFTDNLFYTNFYTCNQGFSGNVVADGRPVILTAGHCLHPVGAPDLNYWYAPRPPGSTNYYAGVAFKWEFHVDTTGDYGLLRPDLVASSWTMVPRFVNWSTSTSTLVNGSFTNDPPQGITICGNGTNSQGGAYLYSICGQINGPVGYSWSLGKFVGAQFTINYPNNPGFSGSPWTMAYGSGGIATGIASSTTSSSYATAVNRIKSTEGLTIP